MPTPPVIKFGVWELGNFVGCVLFSRGANNNLGKKHGLDVTQVCELTRVALNEHVSNVSQIVSMALRSLKKSQSIRLVYSYADPHEGHHGGIYQAMNWIYTGQTTTADTWTVNGKLIHRRAYTGVNYGAPKQKLPQNAKRVTVPAKHRYLYPLDRAMRKQIAPLAQPYPKRDTRPVNGDTLATSEAGRFNSEPGALIEAEPHGD